MSDYGSGDDYYGDDITSGPTAEDLADAADHERREMRSRNAGDGPWAARQRVAESLDKLERLANGTLDEAGEASITPVLVTGTLASAFVAGLSAGNGDWSALLVFSIGAVVGTWLSWRSTRPSYQPPPSVHYLRRWD